MTYEILDTIENSENKVSPIKKKTLGIMWLLLGCYFIYEGNNLFQSYLNQQHRLTVLLPISIISVYNLLVKGLLAITITFFLFSKSKKVITLITIFLGTISLSFITYLWANGMEIITLIFFIVYISKVNSLLLFITSILIYEVRIFIQLLPSKLSELISFMGYLEYGLSLTILSLIILKGNIWLQGNLNWKTKILILFIGFLDHILVYLMCF